MNHQSVTDRARRVPSHFIVLSSIALLLLTWGGWLMYVNHTVQVERDLVRADGYPLTVEDMRAYYPKPAEPHAAQVYEQAFAKIVWNDDTFKGIPLYDDMPPAGVTWPAEMLDRSEQFLVQNDEALQLIEQASRMGPAWFPQWFNGEWVYSLGHIPQLRKASDMLRLKARVHVQRGERQQAYDTAMTAWRLTEAMRDEPVLMSFLVRSTFVSSATGITERLNREAVLTHEQLIELAASAQATQDDGRALLRAAAGERAMMIELFERLKRGEDDFIPSHLTGVLVASGLLQREIAATMRVDRAAIQLAKDRRDDDAALDSGWAGMVMLYLPYEGYASSSSTSIRLNKLQHTRVDALVIGLAAQRFYLDHGSYPDTLDALIPSYVQSIPTDRFSEGPLRYRRTATGAIVYSVGMDGVDDDGRERHTQIRQSSLREGTDITFTLGNAQRELWPEEWDDWPPKPAEEVEQLP